MNSLILYPINIESAPNWVIKRSFEKHFSPFMEYDWVNIKEGIGLKRTQQEFLQILRQKRPDYCFMQLQNPVNMAVSVIRDMAKYTKIINWSGDVRTTKEWYDWFTAIGREIHLSLFSNETDVNILRSRGCRADYLQVGYDDVWYRPRMPLPGFPEIVYCANDYGNFQLSQYRGEVIKALRNHFGERFQVYGKGWQKWGIKTIPIKNSMEAALYNSCKIAISVSNFQYDRYYSDRLLRIMGSGAFPLSHEFKYIEKDFKPGHDIETFASVEDLINKCEFYLANDDKRKTIASNAHLTAKTKCTWDVRCKELISLLKTYGGAG